MNEESVSLNKILKFNQMETHENATVYTENIVGEMSNVHGFWAQYLNTIAKGGNLNVGLKLRCYYNFIILGTPLL